MRREVASVAARAVMNAAADPIVAQVLAALDVGLVVTFRPAGDLRLVRVTDRAAPAVHAQQDVGHVRSSGELAAIIDTCAAAVLEHRGVGDDVMRMQHPPEDRL